MATMSPSDLSMVWRLLTAFLAGAAVSLFNHWLLLHGLVRLRRYLASAGFELVEQPRSFFRLPEEALAVMFPGLRGGDGRSLAEFLAQEDAEEPGGKVKQKMKWLRWEIIARYFFRYPVNFLALYGAYQVTHDLWVALVVGFGLLTVRNLSLIHMAR